MKTAENSSAACWLRCVARGTAELASWSSRSVTAQPSELYSGVGGSENIRGSRLGSAVFRGELAIVRHQQSDGRIAPNAPLGRFESGNTGHIVPGRMFEHQPCAGAERALADEVRECVSGGS